MSSLDEFRTRLPDEWYTGMDGEWNFDCYCRLSLKPKSAWVMLYYSVGDEGGYDSVVVEKYKYTEEGFNELSMDFPTYMEMCKVSSCCSIPTLIKAMKLMARKDA